MKINYGASLFLLCLGLFAVFFILPLVYLFLMAFLDSGQNFVGFENFRTHIFQTHIFDALKNTLIVSLSATMIGVSAALFCAYTLLRTGVGLKNFIHNAALLPLFVPSMMYGLGLVYLFGNKGILTTILLEPLNLSFSIYGAVGIIIAQSICVFPQSFILLYLALKSSDFRLYEQAKIMGISPIKQFFHLTLPSIKFALSSALLLSFILCFTDFGIPVVIGGNYMVLSVELYKQIVGQQNLNLGASIGIILLLPSLLSFFLLRRIEKNNQQELSPKATPYKINPNALRDRIGTAALFVILSLQLAVLLAVFLASIIKSYPYDLSLTLSHFNIQSNIDGLGTLKNSLYISFATALWGTIFSFIFVYCNEILIRSSLLKNAANFFMILPTAVPGLVLGIAYVLFFNQLDFKIGENLYLHNSFYALYGSFVLIVLCNIVHFFSVPALSIKEAFMKIDKELGAMGKILGLSAFSMLKRVYFPLCLPAILESFIYYFLNAMVTISAVIFIYTSSNKVAAITIVHLDEKGFIEEAAALSILIVCINLMIKFTFNKIKNLSYKKFHIC